jgi:hypothetical protein
VEGIDLGAKLLLDMVLASIEAVFIIQTVTSADLAILFWMDNSFKGSTL